MCASLYMCQHPAAVSMYPCPLCHPSPLSSWAALSRGWKLEDPIGAIPAAELLSLQTAS